MTIRNTIIWRSIKRSIIDFPGGIFADSGEGWGCYTVIMSDNQDSTVVESVTGGEGGVSSGGEGGGVSSGGEPGKSGKLNLVPAVVRAPNGKFLPGSGGGITRDNARQMLQARKDKTARLLRDELAKRAESSGSLKLPGNAGPSAVLAAAGGMLFDEIVLNPSAVARYRLDAWREIGSAAELLADRRESVASGGVTVQIGADLARELVAALLQSRKDAE